MEYIQGIMNNKNQKLQQSNLKIRPLQNALPLNLHRRPRSPARRRSPLHQAQPPDFRSTQPCQPPTPPIGFRQDANELSNESPRGHEPLNRLCCWQEQGRVPGFSPMALRGSGSFYHSTNHAVSRQ
jgi:hypothetical protein